MNLFQNLSDGQFTALVAALGVLATLLGAVIARRMPSVDTQKTQETEFMKRVMEENKTLRDEVRNYRAEVNAADEKNNQLEMDCSKAKIQLDQLVGIREQAEIDRARYEVERAQWRELGERRKATIAEQNTMIGDLNREKLGQPPRAKENGNGHS